MAVLQSFILQFDIQKTMHRDRFL